MDKTQVLYFIFGSPSAEQLKLARDSGAKIRNSEVAGASDYIEGCEAVMGDVPAAYEGIKRHSGDKKAQQLSGKSALDELLRSQTFSLLTYPVAPDNYDNFMQGDEAKKVAEIIGTENMLIHGAGAAPGFLSPDATPTEAYYKAIDMIMRRIDEVSLNVQPPQQQESGIAMQLRFQLLNASLSSFAARMQDFENLMWDIVIAWLKSSGTASSTWATDYSLADMQTEISTLQQMQMASAPDSYIKEKMKQLVSLDLGSSNQELISQINAEIDEMEHDDDHSQF